MNCWLVNVICRTEISCIFIISGCSISCHYEVSGTSSDIVVTDNVNRRGEEIKMNTLWEWKWIWFVFFPVGQQR